MQNVTLRPATSADDDFLFELYRANRLDELRLAQWDDATVDSFLRHQYETRGSQYNLLFREAQNWIIQLDHQAVGRHLIQPAPGVWAFVDIGVLPAYQRRGIGTFVFELHLQQAIEASASVRLHVRRDNPARRMYERHGFRVTDQDGVYDEMLFDSSLPTLTMRDNGAR